MEGHPVTIEFWPVVTLSFGFFFFFFLTISSVVDGVTSILRI